MSPPISTWPYSLGSIISLVAMEEERIFTCCLFSELCETVPNEADAKYSQQQQERVEVYWTGFQKSGEFITKYSVQLKLMGPLDLMEELDVQNGSILKATNACTSVNRPLSETLLGLDVKKC